MDAMALPIFSSLHNEISDDVDEFWVCSADDNLVRAWYSRLSPLNCHPLCKLIAPFIFSNILAFDGGETIRTAMLSLLACILFKSGMRMVDPFSFDGVDHNKDIHIS